MWITMALQIVSELTMDRLVMQKAVTVLTAWNALVCPLVEINTVYSAGVGFCACKIIGLFFVAGLTE